MARHSAAFVKLDEDQDNQFDIEPLILPGVKFVSGFWMATFQFEKGFCPYFLQYRALRTSIIPSDGVKRREMSFEAIYESKCDFLRCKTIFQPRDVA